MTNNIITNATPTYTTKTELTTQLNNKKDKEHDHNTTYYTTEENTEKYKII